MIDDASRSGRPLRRRRLLRERLLTLSCVAMVGTAAFGRLVSPDHTSPAAPAPTEPAQAETTGSIVREARYAWMLDPTPALGARTGALGQSGPLTAALARASAPVTTLAMVEPVTAPQPTQKAARFVQTVPLPMPRPSELRRPQDVVRLAERPLPARTRTATTADPEAENSFFNTVFGAKPSTGPQLAYAPLDSDAIDPGTRRDLGPVASPRAGAGTAIYDISARIVTLPSGERLEAHSGLGGSMDDPRFVHLRMRGSTPPGTYDLTEREALFHGVRAIRLNPVGGPGAIHGRAGILAHTYMLGPSGASNGCVSFKNYNRFLAAFLRGEVQRLVVVAGSKQDGFSNFAERALGSLGRTARADR